MSALGYFANMKDHSPQSVAHEGPLNRLGGKVFTAFAIWEGEPIDVNDEYFRRWLQSNSI